MKIIISNDHAGYELKLKVVDHLKTLGHEVIDLGCDSSSSVDYPIYGYKLGREVIKNNTLGIGICGSGVGMAMSANKIKGVRASNCNNKELAILSRQHNNANIITLGARLIDDKLALELVDEFINTKFLGDRHSKRVEMLNEVNENER